MASLNQRLADFAHTVSERVLSILQKVKQLEQRVEEVGKTAGPPGKDGEQGPPGRDGSPGAQGTPGRDGIDGATFTPSVSQAGELTWTNNKGLQNPPSINIKGPRGDSANISISDSVDSDSQTSVASSKAVKTAYDEAKNAKSLADEKISAGTTLEHYGITDAVRQSDLEGFLRNNGQQTITGGDLEINNGDYSSVNLKNPTGKSARFEGRPDSDNESFMHFINKSATNENLFRVKVPKENGTVALRPESPIKIWSGNVTGGSAEFNVSNSIFNRNIVLYLQSSSSDRLSDSNKVIIVSCFINQIQNGINGDKHFYAGYYEDGAWRAIKIKIVNEKRLQIVDLTRMFLKEIYIV